MTNATTTTPSKLQHSDASYCSLGGWGRLCFYTCAGPAPAHPDRVRP